jgi:formate-dependent nitrite reductase membrane component NrfD
VRQHLRQHLRVPRVIPIALAQVGTPPIGHGFVPHWGWYIVLYFFIGGLSAGTYFDATFLLLAGDRRDDDAIRLGYLLAFPLLLICAVLLILDLGVPSRFWHMVVQSKDIPEPMFKPWSPISLGVWILTLFGLFTSVAFLGTLVETGRIRQPSAERLAEWVRTRPRPLLLAWHILGVVLAFGLAGYTGVLVTATTIPVWQNAHLLGALFLASAASTSYALLQLLLLRRGAGPSHATVRKLARADRFSMMLELVLLLLLVLLLGRFAEPLITGGFGVLFWLGIVGLGLLFPLVLQRHAVRGWDVHRRERIAAMCVLVGGLVLRFVVVMSPQYPDVRLWAL